MAPTGPCAQDLPSSSARAHEPDVEEVGLLLHGKEQVAHGDAGYAGADERVARKGLQWQIAAKRGRIKAMP